MKTENSYLGDGAYVRFDGYGLVLTTSNGVDETNEIYLEPSVWFALEQYVARIKALNKPEPDSVEE